MTQPAQFPARLRQCLPEFTDPALLDLALTHASSTRGENNERLEYLGDTVLDLIVAHDLYNRHKAQAEGELTQMKANLVSRSTLAEVARELDLPMVAKVGGGLRRSTLSRSVLANLYEAIVGAVYLDQGLAAARNFVRDSMGTRFQVDSKKKNAPIPKQDLQQYGQQTFGEPPVYELLETRGEAHSRGFLIQATLHGETYPSAWGRSIKEAESWAAIEALLLINQRSRELPARTDPS
ncbi:MAG: ribonuclease III [Planctomycetes bacterium]|nr:ribonuclease III [Planctomycetota bacterium]